MINSFNHDPSTAPIVTPNIISRHFKVPTLIYFQDNTQVQIDVDYYVYDDYTFDYLLHDTLSNQSLPSALQEDLRDALYQLIGLWTEAKNQLTK